MAVEPNFQRSRGYAHRMDQGAEQEAVLALFRDRKSHWASLTDEIESRGSALNVLEARVLGLGEQTELFGVDPDEQLNLELGRARTALQRWAADGIRLVHTSGR
jgi:hypothetical protein